MKSEIRFSSFDINAYKQAVSHPYNWIFVSETLNDQITHLSSQATCFASALWITICMHDQQQLPIQSVQLEAIVIQVLLNIECLNKYKILHEELMSVACWSRFERYHLKPQKYQDLHINAKGIFTYKLCASLSLYTSFVLTHG